MTRLICILLVFFGCFAVQGQSSNAFLIEDQTIDNELVGYLSVAKGEANGNMPPPSAFQKSTEEIVNFGFGTQINWLKLELRNKLPQDKKMVLFLDQVFLQHADFYLYRGDSLSLTYQLNNLTPTTNRPFAHQGFVYPFTVAANQNVTIYLKIQAHPMHGIARALLTLYDQNSFFLSDKTRLMTFGIFMGFILLSVVLGLILFINDPKAIYVIYILCIANVLAYYLCNYGYLNGFSSQTLLGSPQLLNALTMSFAGIHLLLVSYYLDFPKNLSVRFNQFIKILLGLLALTFFAYLSFPQLSFLPLFSRVLMIILTLLVVYLVVWSFQRKQKITYLYAIASLPGLLLVFYFLLGAFDVISLHRFAFEMSFPVSVYEIVTYGFALIYIFNQKKLKAEQRLEEERMAISRKIITAQEQERQRIAQDLHDDLGSTLAILKNRLDKTNDTLENSLDIELKIAEKAVVDLRHISHNLMPTSFLKNGLKEAIEELVMMTDTFKNIDFMCAGSPQKMAWETELSVFRMIKELINNAIKHAEPTKIEVQLIYFEDFLYVSVEDDGKGIPHFNEAETSGIGLKNIHLRTNYLNGKINQESSPKGTLFTIEIPYEQHKNKSTFSR